MRAPKNDKLKDYTHYAEYCLNAVASTRDQELCCAQREMAAEWLRLADLVRRPHKPSKCRLTQAATVLLHRATLRYIRPAAMRASFCADAIQSIGSPIDNRADLVNGLTSTARSQRMPLRSPHKEVATKILQRRDRSRRANSR